VIISFGDRATEDIFNGLNSKTARKIPRAIWHVACRKLDMINAAHELKDLRIPPANRLEKLKGSLSAYCSIRVNEKYRVIFIWKGNNVENVSITDYH
jgi:proteic killer suppression protein